MTAKILRSLLKSGIINSFFLFIFRLYFFLCNWFSLTKNDLVYVESVTKLLLSLELFTNNF